MTMQRYLDVIEEVYQRIAGDIMFAAEYEGNLDGEVLERAFRLLCICHPVLRGRIQSDSQGYLLKVTDWDYPGFKVIDGDEATLLRQTLDRRDHWDTGGAVARLIAIRGDSHGYLLLTLSHSIADWSVYRELVKTLWILYTQLANRRTVRLHPRIALPACPTELLRRWREIGPSARLARPTLPTRTDHIRKGVYERVCVSQEDTARLIRAARCNQLPLSALIGGVISVALHTLESSSTKSRTLKISTVVDLRRSIDPPVGATATTNMVGACITSVTISGSTDPITVARSISADLAAGVAGREVDFFPGLHLIQRPEIDLYINNLGDIEKFAHPTSLRVIDFFRPTPNGATKVPMPLPRFAPCMSGFYTYNGEMTMMFICPTEKSRIIELVEQQLQNI